MAQNGTNTPYPPPPGERLESWKEIAAYLKRSVRTVQEWEKKENLPVHRRVHDKLGTVYAYKAEMDAWWQDGHGRLDAKEAQEVQEAARSQTRWALLATTALGLAAVAVVVLLWWARSPALPFEERDWVLIAQFENRTGEPVFDGTLEFALERELSNSRFVNVVPRVRVNDTLQLMKKPTDAVLTASVGREVALRDGGIRALLTGRVEKLDNTYLLSVALVNPSSGVTVRSFSAEAASQRQVVPSLRRLSGQVREALGEALPEIQKSEQALEKVTTPSLRALQLFSQADRLLSQPVPGGRRDDLLRRKRALAKQAEDLLQRAVTEDSEFASAYMHLAWAVRNQDRPRAEYWRHAERAVELSKQAGERERYLILGSYHGLNEESEKAAVQYEALLRVYPDDYWGNHNLVEEYQRLGRPQDAVSHVKRKTDLRPNDFGQNCRAAMDLPRLTGSLEEAQPYITRARRLSTPELSRQNSACAAYLEFFSAIEHLLNGRMEHVLAETDRVARTLASRKGEDRDTFSLTTADFYLFMGMLRRADLLIRKEPDSELVQWNLARIAQQRGDSQGFNRYIRELSRRPEKAFWFDMPIVYARVGLLHESEKWIRDHPHAVGIDIARGELALARGQQAEATRLLRDGFASVRSHRSLRFFNGAQGLARALESQGDLEGAVRVLEEANNDKELAVMMAATDMWTSLRHQQARLYRKLGREPQARHIEDELRKLLVYADPDHAIARELDAASKLRAEAVPR